MYTPTFLSYQLYHTFAKIRDLNKIFLTDSAKQWIITCDKTVDYTLKE